MSEPGSAMSSQSSKVNEAHSSGASNYVRVIALTLRQDQSIFDRAKYPFVTLVNDMPVIDGKQFKIVTQKLNINRLLGKRLPISKHSV